jgi:hypothetical protein
VSEKKRPIWLPVNNIGKLQNKFLASEKSEGKSRGTIRHLKRQRIKQTFRKKKPNKKSARK